MRKLTVTLWLMAALVAPAFLTGCGDDKSAGQTTPEQQQSTREGMMKYDKTGARNAAEKKDEKAADKKDEKPADKK